jgi:Thioesterase-like superfamily
MVGFLEASAVHRTADGRYQAVLDPQWSIGTKPNGGYLLAILSRAAVDTAGPDHPDPTAVSAHYLSAPPAGPVDVRVHRLRSGRSATQLRASLYASGEHCVEALITCGALPPAGTPRWSSVTPAELPPEEQCVLLTGDDPRFPVPLLRVLAERLDRACVGFSTGRGGSGRGEMRGWVRFADGTEPDPLGLLVAADCLPPATFDLDLLGSWVPTLELTVYVRAIPAPGPLRVRLKVRLITDGRVDEECDVWDSTGVLVATGHQLAGVRLPDAPASAMADTAVAAAD